MKFDRKFCIPSKKTFSMKPVKMLLDELLAGLPVIVDPFSKGSKVGTLTNDINQEVESDYHLDAADFAHELWRTGVKADAIVFDPPYSLEQAKRSYNLSGLHFSQKHAQTVNRWNECKNALSEITKPGAPVISFGYTSSGFGGRRGYEIEHILLLNHGPGHYDTIVTLRGRSKWTITPASAQEKSTTESNIYSKPRANISLLVASVLDPVQLSAVTNHSNVVATS